MDRSVEGLRHVLPRAARAGLGAGLLATTFVGAFVGARAFEPGVAGLASGLGLTLQYVVLGISFFGGLALVQAALLRLLGRTLTLPGYVAGCAAVLTFGAVAVPAELVWLLTHRPIDPADQQHWWASVAILAGALLVGGGAFVLARRLVGALRRQWRYRSAIVLFLAAATAGLLSERLLDSPRIGHSPRGVRLELAPEGAGGPGPGPPGRRRAVIIGLDGATWRIIRPMMERGELPHLERLVRNGASGTLEALEPIESPRIWTSIATGKLPEKHGIQAFLVDRRFIRTSTLWEIADAAGGRVGLYDWLVTYPPQELDGFVIPGWLAGGKSASFPPSLGSRLFLVRSLRHPFWFLDLACLRLPSAYLLEMRGDPLQRMVESQRAKADFKELDLPYLRAEWDPDVLAVTFYGTDVLAHSTWHYMEPQRFSGVDPDAARRYGSALPDYYRRVDRIIGMIGRLYGEDTFFFVVSDHGFGPAKHVDRTTHINADRLLRDLGLARLSAVGGANDYVLIGVGTGGAGDLGGHIDSQSGPILRGAIDQLNALVSVPEGTPLFHADVERASAPAIRLSLNPDLNLDRPHEVRIGARIYPLRRFLKTTSLSGEHDRHGILIFTGPGVKPSSEIAGASVLDITPTALYGLGLPVGRDMDGRVLVGAFSADALATRPVRFIDSYDSLLDKDPPPEAPEVDEELIERLQSLGYLK